MTSSPNERCTIRRHAGFLSAFVAALLATPVVRADDAAAPPSLAVHGFALVEGTGKLARSAVFLEELLRGDLAASSGPASFVARVDLVHETAGDRVEVDPRELYVALTTGPLDLRAGRTIATWGVGDLVFINDVFPKDWDAFFSGRPLEYLKRGVDALSARLSVGVLGAELFVMPSFTPDRLPTPPRFALTDPFAGVPARSEIFPALRYQNIQTAGRMFAQLGSADLAVYGSH